jgi:cytochrome c-type biogenesis protein CcmH
LVTVCALGLVAVPTAGSETRASLPDIEDEVMCPICGTLLAHSEAPQAERERALIRRLIARGESKEEIKDALVDQYGPRVLATPSGKGFDLVAWLVPGLALLAGAMAIAVGVRRALTASRGRAERPAQVDEADARRVSDDMSRYDL